MGCRSLYAQQLLLPYYHLCKAETFEHKELNSCDWRVYHGPAPAASRDPYVALGLADMPQLAVLEVTMCFPESIEIFNSRPHEHLIPAHHSLSTQSQHLAHNWGHALLRPIDVSR